MSSEKPVLIVGAGIGGLACAILLAARGIRVEIVEKAGQTGGKLREVIAGGKSIDAGPTVFTLRWVFDEIFAEAGATLDDALGLVPLPILARHAWSEAERLDLPTDLRQAEEAIGAFAGLEESRNFQTFCREASAVYRTLRDPFLKASRPGPLTLAARVGLHRINELLAIRPFESLWGRLGAHFADQRLRQLFGRYATYCGSSPFQAPATLMLIAYVEQEGVWLIQGGMRRLAEAMEGLARKLGVVIHVGQDVREITIEGGKASGIRLADGTPMAARAVVVNADPAALSDGLFGLPAARATDWVRPRQRSLSAVTWALTARTSGFPLLHHNVFFSRDYRGEFDQLGHRLPLDPTVYICAQDRDGLGAADTDAERLMMLVNAPANGDEGGPTDEEIASCEKRLFQKLELCGLTMMSAAAPAKTTPADFHRLFPGTGGALYGRATHGWRACFRRPGSASAIPGLYLAGGGTHPGAGLPMAALSGRLAALRLIADLGSTRMFHPAVMSGGISTA